MFLNSFLSFIFFFGGGLSFFLGGEGGDASHFCPSKLPFDTSRFHLRRNFRRQKPGNLVHAPFHSHSCHTFPVPTSPLPRTSAPFGPGESGSLSAPGCMISQDPNDQPGITNLFTELLCPHICFLRRGCFRRKGERLHLKRALPSRSLAKLLPLDVSQNAAPAVCPEATSIRLAMAHKAWSLGLLKEEDAASLCDRF